MPSARTRAAVVAWLAAAGCSDRAQPDEPPTPPVAVAAAAPTPDAAGSTSAASTPVPDGPLPDLPPPPSPEPWIRGEVEPGDSLSRILSRLSLDPRQIYAVSTAMSDVMDPSTIQVGQSWAAHLQLDGTLLAFEYVASATRTIRVATDDTGELVAEALEAETQSEVEDVDGTIDSSLWNAVTDAGEQGALVSLLVDIFASNIDFYTDTRKDDRFRVIVEKEYLDGEFLRYGKVLAAEYAGGVGTFRGVRWTVPGRGEAGFFEADGNSLERTLLKSPLKFTRVSSQFNPRRMHPVLHRVKGHNGTDYAAPEGTPVWAAADGRIVFRGRQGGAGNMVILAHDGGMKTLYMHLSRFEDGQKVGQRVRQKQVIGYVGMTGLATGPHLHFSIRMGGKYVDPQSVKAVPRPGVPREHRARFRRETAKMFERLGGEVEAEG